MSITLTPSAHWRYATMSNVPLPEPHHQSAANFNAPDEPFYTADQMHAHAAAVSAAKDAEIAALRADFTALQRAIVGDTGASAILEAGRLRAEVAGLREDAERLDFLLHKLPGDALRYVVGELSDTSDGAEFHAAIDAARKGEA